MAFNRLSSIYRFLDGRFYCPSNSGGAGSCVGPGAAGSGAAGAGVASSLSGYRGQERVPNLH